VTAPVTGTSPEPTWAKYFDHFKHLMGTPTTTGAPPIATLVVQRRMHPDIASMISAAFYADTPLKSHESAAREHGYRSPECVRKTALLWIDTSSMASAAYDRWLDEDLTNLQEAKLTSFFLRGLGAPKQHDPKIPALFLLSPYKAQVRLLGERVRSVEATAIHTVDSVQGRQAEAVIVSLVRNNANDDIRTAIGFLQEPERANVMFSRARRLLVIIGSLPHFERMKNTYWSAVVKHVRSEPRFVVDAVNDLHFEPRG